MPINYVFIDLENIQPSLISQLEHECFRLIVFVGASQNKLPFPIIQDIQKMGERAQYIKISGNGSNALDFHIAYYVGKISAIESSAYFHIISNDSGFDPLIQHLTENKIKITRQSDIKHIPLLKLLELQAAKINTPTIQIDLQPAKPLPVVKSAESPTTVSIAKPPIQIIKQPAAPSPTGNTFKHGDHVEMALLVLRKMQNNKPGRMDKLLNSLHSHFRYEFNEAQLLKITDELLRLGYISTNGTKLNYKLPK